MKKYLIILILFLLALIIFKNTIKSELTSRLAASKENIKINNKNIKESFFEIINDLRNQTKDYLNNLEDEMKNDVEKLILQERHSAADTLTKIYKDIYEHYSEEIDSTFNAIDEKFVETSKHLDDDFAPNSEKLEFINKMKKFAIEKINKLTSKNIQNLKNHVYNY